MVDMEPTDIETLTKLAQLAAAVLMLVFTWRMVATDTDKARIRALVFTEPPAEPDPPAADVRAVIERAEAILKEAP